MRGRMSEAINTNREKLKTDLLKDRIHNHFGVVAPRGNITSLETV